MSATLVAGLAACSDGPTEPDRDTAIRTSADTYVLVPLGLGFGAWVEFEFRNPTDEPVYFPNCSAAIRVVFEAQVSGAWVAANDPGGDDCLSPPIVAPVGGSATGRAMALVRSTEGGGSSGWVTGTEPPGVYRIRVTSAVHNYSSDGAPLGTPVEEEYLVSNAFQLRY